MDFGRHQGKTHEWVFAHDKQYCEWAVLTVVEEGATASPQLKKFATHVEQLLGTSQKEKSQPRRKLLSQTTKLEPEEELAERQAMVRPRKTTAKVQCNVKMMNEQQRSVLRKSGKQLFMGEIDQLTTGVARHADLAETGNVGLSTCELLGGRTLRISRDTGCHLLTREGSSGAARLLRDNCPWRWRDSDARDKTNQKLHRGRMLVQAALKSATQ